MQSCWLIKIHGWSGKLPLRPYEQRGEHVAPLFCSFLLLFFLKNIINIVAHRGQYYAKTHTAVHMHRYGHFAPTLSSNGKSHTLTSPPGTCSFLKTNTAYCCSEQRPAVVAWRYYFFSLPFKKKKVTNVRAKCGKPILRSVSVTYKGNSIRLDVID